MEEECIWTITANEGEIITLTFNSFDVEHNPSQCGWDYLSVWDGVEEDSLNLATLCGDTVPEPITSSSNSLYLLFVSDSIIARNGFNISFHPSSPVDGKN